MDLPSSKCDSTCTSAVREGSSCRLPGRHGPAPVGWDVSTRGAPAALRGVTKGCAQSHLCPLGHPEQPWAERCWALSQGSLWQVPAQGLQQSLSRQAGALAPPGSPHRDLPVVRAPSTPNLALPAPPPCTARLCSLFPHHAESRCLVCCTSAGFNCPCSVYPIVLMLLRIERNWFMLLESVLC